MTSAKAAVARARITATFMIAVRFVDMNGGLCEKGRGQLVCFQSEMCSVAFDGGRLRCGETTGAKAATRSGRNILVV